MKRLAVEASPDRPKVITADSKFACKPFLSAFVGLRYVYALVRLSSRSALRREPPPQTPNMPKRNRKHGPWVRLKDPSPPDRTLSTTVRGHRVRVEIWTKLHVRDLPELVGMVIRAHFLRPDGTPKYKRPLCLYWTGPEDVAIEDLLRMYHMRFTIEHFFRFLKQNLGLLAPKVTNIVSQDIWQWEVALAYWQLILGRHLVQPEYTPWYPKNRQRPELPLTPGQVLNAWGALYHYLDPVTVPPRPCGKAPGRAPGDST